LRIRFRRRGGTCVYLDTEDQSFSETDSAFRLVVRRPAIPRKAVLPEDASRLGVDGENILLACRDVHHPVFDNRRGLL